MVQKLTYYLGSIPTLILGVKNWWQLPLLAMGKRPFTLRLQDGTQFAVRSLMDAWIIKETCLDRDYEVHGTPLQPGWTIVDIGAGLGDFSIFAAKKHASNRVIGLEPFPESFDLLNQNIAINGITNITAVPVAVGKENGRMQLVTSGAAVQHSTSLDDIAAQNATRIDVQTRTLDALFADHGIEQCDFLKLDCEGGEYDILFNASDEALSKISYICMEYHNNITQYSHQDLANFLQKKGFIVQTTVNPVHEDLGFLFAIGNKSSL